MKLLALLAAASQAEKDECCDFVKIVAFESMNKIYDGMYRKITTGTQYGSHHHYELANSQGELAKGGFSIIYHKDKWNFTKHRNKRIPRKNPVWTEYKGECLEYIDKDRNQKIFDTKCMMDPTKPVGPVSPYEFQCKKNGEDYELDNDGWVERSGCAMRMCAEWRVADAWRLGNGRKNGFALDVKVPEVSFNKGWTLAIRFPLKPQRGTFQSWNAFFWNVYERNGELVFLMHQPWWWTDRQDKTSITFVADHMPTEIHPKVHLYKGRQKNSRCYSDDHGQRQEGSIKSLRSEEDIETEQSYSSENVKYTKIVIKDGKIFKQH